ncbi:MAG: MtaA/CmuA family methyltransferase [Alphaproteobacteria bacterium]|uniref:MtaA/CmuA family methyltransferase n=1 Tax=Candidatus Nitrobium versatile TaxID=2884831 RepID=A0A953LZ18_9BACT|nr:MtaA/CmuA family methyltransferase [Candidatus Nitrobium versatile]
MTGEKYSPRERVLRLFRKEEIDRVPVFSGMGNVTVHGLKESSIPFSEVHTDPKLMAATSSSTYRLFGLECAVVPYDIAVEAEILGCTMNTYSHRDGILYPTIKDKIVKGPADIKIPGNLAEKGRLPVITEAIRILKKEIGEEVAVGTYVLGPFLLAGQVMDLEGLLKQAFKNAETVNEVLGLFADLIIAVADVYRNAGADYITIREMGASTDVLSPRMFRSLVKPHLDRIMAGIPMHKVLHICGNTNPIVGDMANAKGDAISVEKKTEVSKARQLLGKDALIFGNLDTYQILCLGSPEDVEKEVLRALEDGVSAVWPGCDLWPEIPAENMRIMVETVKANGRITG